jgi:hypothetical protein
VADYGQLADKLKSMRTQTQKQSGVDPAAFYENVKAHVGREMEKANAELRKRKMDLIERVFLPSFQGRLCLTLGSDYLCTVDLVEGKGRIVAVVSGPPNAQEIAHKEFLIEEKAGADAISDYGAVKAAAGCSPEQIAVEIVSGLLMREFS